MTNTKQLARKMLYEKFSFIQAIKNEQSGNAYTRLSDFLDQIIDMAIAKGRKNTLKELIQEYQNSELDGKGYDFYFAIRTKLDNLINNTK